MNRYLLQNKNQKKSWTKLELENQIKKKVCRFFYCITLCSNFVNKYQQEMRTPKCEIDNLSF